jgi:hypothetical protein
MTFQSPKINEPAEGSSNDQPHGTLGTHSKVVHDREITRLIGSVDFGNWLIDERTEDNGESIYENAEALGLALTRAQTLKIAETALFEFLTQQQAMLDKAQKARLAH